MSKAPARPLAGLLYDLGRALQRVSGFLLAAVLVGLPLAVLAPRSRGLVLVVALGLVVAGRLARR